jgi:hypothetical protein
VRSTGACECDQGRFVRGLSDGSAEIHVEPSQVLGLALVEAPTPCKIYTLSRKGTGKTRQSRDLSATLFSTLPASIIYTETMIEHTIGLVRRSSGSLDILWLKVCHCIWGLR